MTAVTPVPLVSILIPAYNAERFLGECIRSAVDQTYPAIEIVIVDDGSTDATLAIARRFEGSKVKVISQPNGGQPAAVNAAAAAAQGAYFQYLDADDLLHPAKIERQIARLTIESPATLAACPWARFVGQVADARFVREPIWVDLDPVTWHVTSWSGGGMMHVASWLIPRRVVEAAGPWVPALRWAANIDADFFSRALLASDGCAFVNDALAYYRSVPLSHSARRDGKSLAASLDVLLRTGEALLVVENSERTRRAFADNLQRFVYDIYPDAAGLVALAEARINSLVGSSSRLRFVAGPATTMLSRLIGWKNAKKVRRMLAS